ncbi:unnamed protein product, partial [Brenthis ino]
MIPPNLLLEHAVSLSRVVPNPGEFIIVFPKSFSSSICTGYTVSESVYFATNSWMHSINQVFQVKGVFRMNGSLCLPHVVHILEDKDKEDRET